MVADAFEKAMRTMLHLRPVKVLGYFNTWPEVRHRAAELSRQTPKPLFCRLAPRDISEMEHVLAWITWLEDIDEIKLIWAKANCMPWIWLQKSSRMEKLTICSK